MRCSHPNDVNNLRLPLIEEWRRLPAASSAPHNLWTLTTRQRLRLDVLSVAGPVSAGRARLSGAGVGTCVVVLFRLRSALSAARSTAVRVRATPISPSIAIGVAAARIVAAG